jgi:hypothetical protein
MKKLDDTTITEAKLKGIIDAVDVAIKLKEDTIRSIAKGDITLTNQSKDNIVLFSVSDDEDAWIVPIKDIVKVEVISECYNIVYVGHGCWKDVVSYAVSNDYTEIMGKLRNYYNQKLPDYL